MLVQICFLCKSIFTSFLMTNVWSLIRMNSKVIKEIMPFPKILSTVTSHYFYFSLWLYISESENFKFLCLRYKFSNLYWFDVKSNPILYSHSSVLIYFIIIEYIIRYLWGKYNRINLFNVFWLPIPTCLNQSICI
jgi:hypothetical protein